MTPLAFVLFAAHFSGAAITCWYALCALNACTGKTPLATRLSFAGIAIGSFATLLHLPDMDLGGMGAALAFGGLAIGFLANRRECGCLHCPARPLARRADDRHTGAHA